MVTYDDVILAFAVLFHVHHFAPAASKCKKQGHPDPGYGLLPAGFFRVIKPDTSAHNDQTGKHRHKKDEKCPASPEVSKYCCKFFAKLQGDSVCFLMVSILQDSSQ